MLFAFQTPAQTGIMATLLRRAPATAGTGETQVNPAPPDSPNDDLIITSQSRVYYRPLLH